MHRIQYHPDPLRPPGYRFVVQFIDEPTEAEARARYERMSGKELAAKAKLVQGTVDLRDWYRDPKLTDTTAMRPSFRIYLPENNGCSTSCTK